MDTKNKKITLTKHVVYGIVFIIIGGVLIFKGNIFLKIIGCIILFLDLLWFLVLKESCSVTKRQSNQELIKKFSQEDEEYEECRQYVIQYQKVNASMLQRKFRIGYDKAVRIINHLEEEGVIGPQNDSKYRTVLIKLNDGSKPLYDPWESKSKKKYDLYDQCLNIKSGIEFENFLSNLLMTFDYRTSTTPKSNDYGVDILAERDGIKYAIQCKYYSSPVGISAVQEVLGGLQYYNCNVAIVATNSTFTRQAVQLANNSNVILWDGEYIINTFILMEKKNEL